MIIQAIYASLTFCIFKLEEVGISIDIRILLVNILPVMMYFLNERELVVGC